MSITISARDRSRAISTIIMAFAADPVIRWLFPEPDDYLRFWPRFAEAYGGRAIPGGTGQATDDFSAVALWLPPGVSPDEDGIVEVLDAGVLRERRGVADAALEQMDAFHPTEDHYYLTLAGVDPPVQGQGVGSVLLRAGTDRCDEQGLPAYLEATSKRSRDLYARHGFKGLGIIQTGQMPPMWPMLREPA